MTKDAESIRDALELGDVDITKIDMDSQRMTFHVYASTMKDGLKRPVCGGGAALCGARPREWRRLDVGASRTIIHYSQPRAKCPRCGVHSVLPPWAPKEKSHFTEAFEEYVMRLAASAPILRAAMIVGENDRTIWGTADRRASEGMKAADRSGARRIGVGEASSRKGHKRVAVFAGMDTREALFAATGKDASAMEAFADDLRAHGGDPKNIQEIAMDMPSAFISGAKAQFPLAKITFDKFV
jgi:transposase